MSNWTTSEWLALATLIVAIVGIPSTVLATRAFGNRRARLLFNCRAVPLLPEGDQHGLVKVTYRDFDVADPHLVTISIANIGPTDIPSEAFDQGRGIRVDLKGTVFYGVVSVPPAKERGEILSQAVGTDDGYIVLGPALLRRGAVWTVEVLVSGDPDPELTSSLINTDVVRSEEDGLQVGFRVGSAALSASIPIVGGALSSIRTRPF
jgi:hypothetical protein